MKILVTGSNGFIGRSLCKRLSHFDLIKPGRHRWSEDLAGVDYVIHLASIVHQQNIFFKIPLSKYREVNTLKTLNFAKKAISAGVKRFIFVSSISVNGNISRTRISPDDIPIPKTPYAMSKWEAERGLKKITKKSKMELVIVRPPLVYGPGVKSNFHTMIKYIHKGLPIPMINSKKSFVFIDNLTDLLVKVIDHPNAAGETFFVSDDEDISLKKIMKDLSREFGYSPKFINIPQKLLIFFLKIIGQKNIAASVFNSLLVDIKKTKQLLSWTPPIKYSQGIKITVQSYLDESKV